MTRDRNKQPDAKRIVRPTTNITCSIVVTMIWLLTFCSLALNNFQQKSSQALLFSAAILMNINPDPAKTR